MKKTLFALLALALICVCTGCGKETTKKCVYQDDRWTFGVEIPVDWTYEIIDTWNADPEAEAVREVGLRILIDGREENEILVTRSRGEVGWHYGCAAREIELRDHMSGRLVEGEEECEGETYRKTGVVIKPFHSIRMCLKEDVYAANKKEIDALIQSFQIY